MLLRILLLTVIKLRLTHRICNRILLRSVVELRLPVLLLLRILLLTVIKLRLTHRICNRILLLTVIELFTLQVISPVAFQHPAVIVPPINVLLPVKLLLPQGIVLVKLPDGLLPLCLAVICPVLNLCPLQPVILIIPESVVSAFIFRICSAGQVIPFTLKVSNGVTVPIIVLPFQLADHAKLILQALLLYLEPLQSKIVGVHGPVIQPKQALLICLVRYRLRRAVSIAARQPRGHAHGVHGGLL